MLAKKSVLSHKYKNTIFTPKFYLWRPFQKLLFYICPGTLAGDSMYHQKPWQMYSLGSFHLLGCPHILLILLLFLLKVGQFRIEIERVEFCAWAIFSEGPRIFSTRDEVSNLPPLLSRSTSSRLQLDPDKNDDSCLKKKKTHQEDLLNISGIGAFWLELVLSSWIIGG